MIKSAMGIKDEVSFQTGKGFLDNLGMAGNFVAELFDKNGVLKDKREVHNTVTVLGHKMAADQILESVAVDAPNWMEVGTGTGQDANDSTLATYISGSRTVLDSKTRGANAVITMVCTFPAGTGTGTITEAGVFNVVTQNTTDLILVSSFGAITKAAGDSLVVTWTLTFS